jgi:cobalt/nickel transport system permease protein
MVSLFLPFLKDGEVIAGAWNIGFIELNLSYNKILIFWNILIKSLLCCISLLILSSTTKFSELLLGLQRLYFPKILIMILSFMYRYIFVLVDEAQRMERARRVRYFGSRYLAQFRVLSNIIGLLFIRTYERAERIYQAMCARCFIGEIIYEGRHLRLTVKEPVYLIVFISALGLVKML